MKRLFCLLFIAGSVAILRAQSKECTLGVGGKDTEVIIKVFKLDDAQQEMVRKWAGELEEYHRIMGDSIRTLFDTHPQKTMEELQLLANKYRVLRNKIENTASLYDRKLLATFSERQYEQYRALCREASRDPMPVYLEEGDEKIPE